MSVTQDTLASVAASTFTVITSPGALECVVDAYGEIGVTTVARFRGSIRYAMACGAGRLILDISKVSIIDSIGLRALETAHRRSEDLGIHLVVRAPTTTATRLFKVTGLDQILTVVGGAGRPSPAGGHLGRYDPRPDQLNASDRLGVT
jgi:anti-anti-sigma factor